MLVLISSFLLLKIIFIHISEFGFLELAACLFCLPKYIYAIQAVFVDAELFENTAFPFSRHAAQEPDAKR